MLADRGVRMGSYKGKKYDYDSSGSPGSPYLIAGTMEEGFLVKYQRVNS